MFQNAFRCQDVYVLIVLVVSSVNNQVISKDILAVIMVHCQILPNCMLILLLMSHVLKESCLTSDISNYSGEFDTRVVSDISLPHVRNYNLPTSSVIEAQTVTTLMNQNDTMKKINELGSTLKNKVEMLHNNKKLDVVFLVDASSSVGDQNFNSELRFVKKLLADFAISINETRAAVITFSDEDKVIRFIDHISVSSEEYHKCNMLHHDLPSIKYSGGLTYTLGALVEAQSVLEWSRPGAQKAVFLITDGFSNGGDPIPVAQILKDNGTLIFTFGIQSGNIVELEIMSSSPSSEFSYLVDSFDQFEALVRRAFHQDLSVGSYQHLNMTSSCDSLCPDDERGDTGCCDSQAHCSCGTGSGHYRCLCNPGYYGFGLMKSCHACPIGTYHNGQTPGDESTCLRCPDPNHITEVGTASSRDSCICKRGFIARGDFCEVITCPLLFPPEHGYFVKGGMCPNVFNAACGMRCKPGYSLHGTSIRLCLENGTWSGRSPKCVVKMCPDPEVPTNGDIKCSLEPALSNDLLDPILDDAKALARQYTVDTECQFSCKPGHILIGSRRRHCLPLARWDGLRTVCKPVVCRPLSKISHGTIVPAECTESSKMPLSFGQKCNITCDEGYKLVGPSFRTCGGRGGQWSMKATASKCTDEQPPSIVCPVDIQVTTDPGENFATVVIPQPTVSDNSGKIPLVWSQPTVTVPMQISTGTLRIIFIAMDPNHNQATCNMTVDVLDKEPPFVESCISPNPIHLLETGGNRVVSWMEPEFQDNSGKKLKVVSSHSAGDFPTGKTEVTVVAYDESGNNSTCVLEVIVEESPCSWQPPKQPHATIICNSEDQDQGLINCTVTCNEGYAFDAGSLKDIKEFMLSEDGSLHYSCSVVNGHLSTIILPQCAETVLPNSVSQDAEMTFTVNHGACEDTALLTKVKNTVESELIKKSKEVCQTGNYACNILNTNASCEAIASLQEEETNLIHLRKRSLLSHNEEAIASRSFLYTHPLRRERRETETHQDSHINVHFRVTSHLRNGLEGKKLEARHPENFGFKQLKDSLSRTPISIPLSNIKGQTLNWKGRAPSLNCSDGSVAHSSGICVQCPSGTFFSSLFQKCLLCPHGEYQSLNGQKGCVSCPIGMSTKYGGARDERDCLYLCQPGSYGRIFSSNPLKGGGSVSPCTLCHSGSYQPNYGATNCLPCPKGSQSFKKGAKNVKDCSRALLRDTWSQPDGCLSFFCLNGGSCQAIPLGFVSCKCEPGFYGAFCEYEKELCSSNPCLNGGQCSKKSHLEYTCECPAGFQGQNCEIEKDECRPNPCLNNGTCEDLTNGFFCDCPDGFQGYRCEENLDDCFSNPCGEHGQCIDGISSYHCSCTDGYSGRYCDKEPVDPCFEKDPCLNGGSCKTHNYTSYSCICPKGWEGKHCDSIYHACSSSPCLNNGTCVEENEGKYHCQCSSTFVGDVCQIYLRSDFVLHMYSPSITDYAVIDIPLRNLTEITACLWLQSEDGFNYGTAFSYANGQYFNSFTLTDYNGFVLYVNGERVVTDVSANDGLWHHVCVIWHSHHGLWSIYLDGTLRDSGSNLSTNSTVLGGGKLVLGQEQDSVGGSFSEAESLVGRMFQLDIWDYSLNPSNVSKLAKECQQDIDGSLVKWSDFLPSIRGKVKVENSTFCLECPPPEPLWHGSVILSEEGDEIIANYECEKGFALHKTQLSMTKRRCLKQGSWEGATPVCVRKSCGFPDYLPGGTFLGRSFMYTDRVKYVCHSGAEMIGDESRVCQADGKWSGEAPICKGHECPALHAPEHGRIKMDEKTGGIQTASYSCDEGFSIDGVPTLTCMHDGAWNEAAPECIRTNCSLLPQFLHAFHINKSITLFFFMDTVHYKCEPGYEMVSSSSSIIYCNKNGEWYPQPQSANLPSCAGKSCLEPDDLYHGFWVMQSGSGNKTSKFATDSVLVATCDPHYDLHGPRIKQCNESVWWPLDATQCVKRTCDTDELPYDVPHSHLQLSGEEVGDTATLSCKEGHQLHFAKSGTTIPANNLSGKAVANTSVLWVCNSDGFWLMNGNDLSDSSSETEWLACLPVKEITPTSSIVCNQPQAPIFGYILTNATQINYLVGSVIEVRCRPGFWLDGSYSLVCARNGNWLGSSVCRPIRCHSLPQFPNMLVSSTSAVGNSMVFRDTVTFSCIQGFQSQGALSVRCQSNGKWSPLMGMCVPI